MNAGKTLFAHVMEFVPWKTQRDWRIYHALAQRLIVRARALYAQDSVLELGASVYVLDATTIDLCLSLFAAPTDRTSGVICDQRINRFLGTSENAVKTQIWCAVSTYVLIAIVKREFHFDASLYTCLQILSVSVFEKTEVSCALQPDRSEPDPPIADNQLILFDFTGRY